jgi:hypothetical protein
MSAPSGTLPSMETHVYGSDHRIAAFRYEVWMYRQTRLLPIHTFEPLELRNAVVESALLHTRVLIDVLLDHDSKTGDDLLLRDLLPTGYPQPLVERLRLLRKIYGHRHKEESPCWTLNKRVMHLTTVRTLSFDFYNHVFGVLDPIVGAVLREIGIARPGLVLSGQENVGIPTVASTSSSAGATVREM